MQNDSRALLGELQRSGVTEINDVTDERLGKIQTTSQVSSYERNLRIAETSLETLNRYSPSGGGIGAMFRGRREITAEDYAGASDRVDSILAVAREICDNAKSATDLVNEIGKCEMSAQMLSRWESLDISMQKRKTEKTSIFIGIMPDESTEDALNLKISEKIPDTPFDLTVLSAGAGQTFVCIIAHNDDSERVYNTVRALGFTNPSETSNDPPSVQRQEILRKIDELKISLKDTEDRILSLTEHRDDIEFLVDYLTVRHDEYKEIEKLGVGNTVMVCEGYVPEKHITQIEKICERFSAVAEFSDPEEDEDVPVVLENGSFAGPMESVIEMYSMPGKKDIDPSSVMAFFYYFLFGMMLSDAGYGIIMTIFSAVVLKRSTVEGSMAKMLKMFFWCGISTTIWGILFGSFFGDIIPVICTQFLGLPAPDLALWFKPIEKTITLLLFSLGIGICHLLLGLSADLVIKCRKGEAIDGVLGQLSLDDMKE